MGSCLSVNDTIEDTIKIRSEILITLIEKNKRIKELEAEVDHLKRQLSRSTPLLSCIPEEVPQESSSTQTE